MNKKSSRGAKGGGSIRKRENGLWEARYTTGFDAKTGKQIQKSIYGKTQKEVRQKLSEVIAEIDRGDYCEPCQMSINQWLDIWLEDYTTGIKDSTRYLYERQAKLYIRPSLGNTKLNQLETHSVQRLYNQLGKENGLSPKSIKNVHGILHRALQQAQRLGYIRSNPTEACILPRVTKKDISPMTDQQMGQFLEAIQGHQYELFFKVDLFTGLREGELLGLKWECVDFDKGTILVDKQLHRSQKKGGGYYFSPPKSNKSRTLRPAPYRMSLLRQQKTKQAEMQLRAGPAWQDSGLVFTNEQGRYVSLRAVYDSYKRIVKKIGLPNLRIHDLRHNYAVNSIRAGDDIKSLQSNLGHATAAFTLDIYGHFTEDMQSESSQRMEHFIENVLNL